MADTSPVAATASTGSSASAATNDLVSLVMSHATSTVYPSDDAIVATLQARFRAGQPYSRLGATTLVVVNPLRASRNLGDESADEYVQTAYSDTTWESQGRPHPDDALPPHPYELALRAYLRMRRTQSSQAILLRWVLIIPLNGCLPACLPRS